MNDINKNIRSDEVEEALKILESKGDAAMDEYLLPRGLNWMRLESRLLLEETESLIENFNNLRLGIQYDPDALKELSFFVRAKRNAFKITKLADAIKDIFQTHFGVFLDEEKTE